jgi:acyl-ACP thioesterase
VLPPTPDGATHRPIEVRRHEVDPLRHANNGAYVDWLEESVTLLGNGHDRLAALPRRYVVEYVAPAELDDALDGAAWVVGSDIAYRLSGAGADHFRGTLGAVVGRAVGPVDG